MAYRLEDTPAARRDLQALPRPILIRVEARIQALAENPRPPRAHRLRVGAYRILYTVDDARHVVTIARVRHRGDVYRRL